jgi:FkbM family methyltransferase
MSFPQGDPLRYHHTYRNLRSAIVKVTVTRRLFADNPGLHPRGRAAAAPAAMPAAPSAARPPCPHEGRIVADCPRGDEGRHLRQCLHDDSPHDTCRRAVECAACPFHLEAPRPPAAAVPAVLLRRDDESTLWPGIPGKRFNTSLIAHGDGYAFAFRHGWEGSDIYVGRLDRDFRPVGDPVRLDLFHPQANYGREDPRLFRFRGRLHVGYIGVRGNRRILYTSVLYARLRDDFTVEQIYFPEYERRNYWEKNWTFFEHGGRLYAVYAIAPHKVLAIDGERVELAYEVPTPAPWGPGTEMRGGASPVRVGDQFYSFFHSRSEVNGLLVYTAGLYTFDARPPFRVRRIIPEPILVADPATKPADQYAAVVFPGGAVLCDGRWVIAAGVHDRWTELYQFDAAALERRLVRVGFPNWWSYRRETNDNETASYVAWHDEYRLGDLRLSPGDVVLDVGGHVGGFAFAAWTRGSRAVHTYEPDAGNRAHLLANAANMPGVIVWPEAVAGGGERLYSHPPPGGARDTSGCYCSADPAGGAPVPVISLDAAIGRAAGPAGRVALLKLDCEGCEWSALAGCTRLGDVDRIALEYHAGGDPAALRQLLQAHGFRVEMLPAPDNPSLGLLFADRRPA